MQLIQAGRTEQAWPRQITLRCCDAVVIITPEDIKTDRDYTGDFNGYYVDCPSCGSQPGISESMKSDGDRWRADHPTEAPATLSESCPTCWPRPCTDPPRSMCKRAPARRFD